MNAWSLDQLPHLRAALAFKGRSGLASCVQRSAALALDLRQGVMTFGTLPGATPEEVEEIGPASSLVPFIHCWVELRDHVLAPTTIERTDGLLCPMPRASYYEINGVRDVRPVPRAAFDAIARRYRLSAALRHGSERLGRGEVSEALLAAARVRYVLGAHRALLPASIVNAGKPDEKPNEEHPSGVFDMNDDAVQPDAD